MWLIKALVQPWLVTNLSKNCYPNKAQHQVNRSLNAVIKDKGNNCAIKIKITTSLMKLRLNPKKLPAYKQSEETWKLKWLWATELGKWIMKGFWNYWSTQGKDIISLKLHLLTWRNDLCFFLQAEGQEIYPRQEQVLVFLSFHFPIF